MSTPLHARTAVTQHLGQRSAAVVVGVLFCLVLTYCVQHFVAGPFRYMGYVERSWTASDVVIALIATVLLVLVVGARIDTPGRGALAFLVAFVGAPVIWLPVFYGVLDQKSLMKMAAFVIISFALTRCTMEIIPSFLLPTLSGRVPTVTMLMVAAAGGIALIIWTTGLSLDWLSFADVYDQRDEYGGVVTPMVAYTVGWVGSGILPVLAALGVHRRSPLLAAVGFGGLGVIYLLTGFKSYLLGAILVLVVSLFIGRRRVISTWMVYGGVAVAVVLSMVLDRITGNLVFTSLGVRRAFATAGINTAYFFDFFEENPTYQLRHSVLDTFGEAPYSVPPARLIGLQYYGSLDTAANANYLADGIANFGTWGMLGAAVVIGIWLKLVDITAERLPLAVSFAAIIIVLVSFSNTAGLTVLATHGGFMILAALWMLSESDYARHNEPAATTADPAVPDTAGRHRSTTAPTAVLRHRSHR